MLQNLETLAREAKSWPFEQARNLLAHVLKKRLGESERAEARALIDAGKADEALAKFEALQKPVLLETGYGPSGLPHMGTFGEVARTTMVRNAFRTLTGDPRAAFGITALIFAVPYAYDAIRFAGAAYLLWLAWKIANAAAPTTEGDARGNVVGGERAGQQRQ